MNLPGKRLWDVFFGSSTDAESREFGAEDHNVGRYPVVIRDVDPDGPTPWGHPPKGCEPPEIRGITDHGYGELKTAGMDKVRERVNPYAHEPGTIVATVVIDLDEWDYRVEWGDQ